MVADGRCIRGFVALELVRALREQPGAQRSLTAPDRQLLAEGIELSGWVELQQCLRLAAAAHEHVCAGDWSRLHELGAGSIEWIIDLGYRAVVHVGDPAATFSALSVLWRASFNYGRALADTDDRGVTIHVIDCPPLRELDGHIHAGWCLGIARLTGTDGDVELRRRPWADGGDEQVVRLHWRGRTSNRRPTPLPRQLPPVRAAG